MNKRGAYYNEFDSFAAQWLRNLIAAGHIAPGDVDERSITDVQPAELAGYTQCHFFAGIGGWSYALRLAGWPDDRHVWTGSCPCQPFSAAGKGAGADDPRHLWPTWFRLIRECRPGIVFGEQVSSKDGLAWLDLVYSDLEGARYAVWAADSCAAGVGAPHIRQRLYFVVDAGQPPIQRRIGAGGSLQPEGSRVNIRRVRSIGILADAKRDGGWADEPGRGPQGREVDGRDSAVTGVALGDATRAGLSRRPGQSGNDGAQQPAAERTGDGTVIGMEESEQERRRGRDNGRGNGDGQWSIPKTETPRSSSVGYWSDAVWLPCRDGKARPTQTGLFPLAYGLPAGMGRMRAGEQRLAELAGLDSPSLGRAKRNRIGRLRGYGNAIVPQVAAEFIGTYMDHAAPADPARRQDKPPAG